MFVDQNYFPGAVAANGSFATLFGLAFTLAMGLLMLVLPRRHALLPVIVLTCFMPLGVQILVLGFHFTMLRLLLLFGWARVAIRREFVGLKLNPIDTALLWWVLSGLVAGVLLWRTSEALVYRLGQSYNAIGMYFLFRFVVRDFDDMRRAIKITAVLIVPLAAAMLLEWATGRNVFSSLGAVNPIAQVRDGVTRCEGPFSHPILAGTFAATLLPFFVALWRQGRGQGWLAGLAILAATIIIITCGSSGPIFTFSAALLALAMWPWRRHMRTIRYGLVFVLIVLHLTMKAPVWFLIARVDLLSSSTGWHRAYLIDQFIAAFPQWWLLGMKTTDAFGEQIHGDITNQYATQGIEGGLITLVLFILIIVRCFRGVGRFQALSDEPAAIRQYVWGLGAILFAHIVTYFSVTYFDQNIVSWYLLLAMISAATGQFLTAPQPQPVAHQQLSAWPKSDRAPALEAPR